MKKWLGTQASINIAKVLSIQELMNSTPRHYYDEHESGTVYEEDCPITEEQVFLDESTTTEGCERIIPSICDVHSIYDYIADYGGEDGVSMFHQELEYQLRKGGPLSIQFEVYPSYYTTQGNLYNPSNSELEFIPLGGHYVIATALGTLDGFLALECQDTLLENKYFVRIFQQLKSDKLLIGRAFSLKSKV
ncbi:predicted protein [Arabidopsis lyrata subsp. lyrata]|uniref:Predicted protein n=1 Tax=Arabidopsis lyrata subsp. lyrata TaxID=81972 RepID=D7MHF2_ARALL|nr:predicted protein [Arabidopsis lyrata subsp. lyrata]